MALDLPVRLRLLIPAVENSIGGARLPARATCSRMRSGTTVEITNTDAEGRLVLADALAEADGEEPAPAARRARRSPVPPGWRVGPELPALFTPDDELAEDLLAAGRRQLRSALAPAAARALSRLHEEPGGRSRQRQQQAVRRRDHRGPVPQGVRQADQRPGRISTCSPGTTTAVRAARAAARPRRCARCSPWSRSASAGRS